MKSRKRILIVDDDEDIRDSLAMLLDLQYDTGTAADGKDALRMLEAEHYDAILLDLMMPVLNGEELVAELHKRKIEIPIAMLSAARDLPEVAARCGVTEYINKPVRFETLLQTLSRLLSDGSDSTPPSGSDAEEPAADLPGGPNGDRSSRGCATDPTRRHPPSVQGLFFGDRCLPARLP